MFACRWICAKLHTITSRQAYGSPEPPTSLRNKRDPAMTDQPAAYASLRNKSVLITGGATGIGADIVRSFARQGAKVAFIDIDAAAGKALSAELSDGLHCPRFIEADLLEVETFDAIV